MATWTEFAYGPHTSQRAEKWVPATGTNRPCLIYFHGGGWSRGDPSAFYDPTVSGSSTIGEQIFLDGTYGIESREVSTPVVCISAHYGKHRYDYHTETVGTKWDDDSIGTAYVFGDLRKNDPSGDASTYTLYRCRDAHTSTTADEPGVGANWADFWYVVDVNDLSGAKLGQPARSPRYLATGIDNGKRLVQWAKDNATALGIDPLKIIVMGSSAGGQLAGTVAYDYTAPYYDANSGPVAQPFTSRSSSKPLAAVLKITPADWQDYDFDTAMAKLWGRSFTSGEWDAYPDAAKAALSPLGVLDNTQSTIPTYLEYQGSTPSGAAKPWDGREHDADNGTELQDALVSYGETTTTCPFYHDGNAPSNWAQSMWDWLAVQWGV